MESEHKALVFLCCCVTAVVLAVIVSISAYEITSVICGYGPTMRTTIQMEKK